MYYFISFERNLKKRLSAKLRKQKQSATTTLLPNIFGNHVKKAGPSAWMCTTSYLPNALESAAKKEELTAASPPDVKIGATNFSKKAKNKPHKVFLTIF